jgi:hypothetical protein
VTNEQRNDLLTHPLLDAFEAGTHLNGKQEDALRHLCDRYHVTFSPRDYKPAFDLPRTWVAGWVGGHTIQRTHPTIYVGCDPEGRISS